MPPLIDDRGRSAPSLLTRREGVAEWPLRGDERIDRLVDRLGLVLRPGCLTIALLTLGACAIFGLLTFSVLLASPGFYGLFRAPWMGLGGVGMGMAAGWLHWRWRAARRMAEVCKLLLQEGLCPSCGYNYCGLAPDTDGCIVCPECGIAWRESRIVRAEPFVPVSALVPAQRVLARTRMARRGARWSSDDRGTFIQVATRPPRPGSARDAGHLARIDRATTSLVQQGRRTRWTIAGVFLALGLAALGYQAGSIWLSSAPLNTTRTVIVIVAIAACVGIAAAVLTGELGREPRGVIRSLTREGLCASCTADLSEADIEEDGCVVCLECGAAWHI